MTMAMQGKPTTSRIARQRELMNELPARELHERSPHAAASYIAALTEELAQLARRQGLDGLGYILEMARMEADQIVKGAELGDGP